MLEIFDRTNILKLKASNVTVIIRKNPPHIQLIRGDKLLLETSPIMCVLYINGQTHRVVALQRWWQVENSVFLIWHTDAQFRVMLSLQFELRYCTLHWRDIPKELDAQIEMSFRLDNAGHWYGQGLLRNQPWPLERASLSASPFITRHHHKTTVEHSKFESIQTPLWVTSSGVGIMAFPQSQLEIGFNAPIKDTETGEIKDDGLLRLRAAAQDGLRFKINADANIKESCFELFYQMKHPYATPPHFLFERPIWSTHEQHRARITQSCITHFAEEIIVRDFPHAFMEIDSRWENICGDLAFDSRRFPAPLTFVEDLHGLGFGVVLRVTPFVSTRSRAFPWGQERGYFIRRADGSPYLLPWDSERAALLDISHPEALQWFLSRLRALEIEYGIDGFHFTGGEADWLPPDAVTAQKITGNDYTRFYVDFIARCFPLSAVNVGWFSQQNPILFCLKDLEAKWEEDKGLGELLPQILTLAVTGYQFIVPGVISGKSRIQKHKAPKELYIRWAEATAALPMMQFSRPPWEYDKETVDICRHYVCLRQQEFAPYIAELVRNIVLTGEPLARPLFWEYPEEEESYLIADQFLLGTRYLIAPMLRPGTTRDIYLPPGEWRDWHTHTLYTGPTTLENYRVPLDRLPIFKHTAD